MRDCKCVCVCVCVCVCGKEGVCVWGGGRRQFLHFQLRNSFLCVLSFLLILHPQSRVNTSSSSVYHTVSRIMPGPHPQGERVW